MRIYIYALKDPETGLIRYIGRTKCPSKRLCEHHQEKRLKTKTHHNHWIRSLIQKGLRAKMEILEECDESNWSEREKHWIATLPNLSNTTAGGEGEYIRFKKRIQSEDEKNKIGLTVSTHHKNGIYKESYPKLSRALQGRKKPNSKSIYCGVFATPNKTFFSHIRFNGKIIFLGVYENEKDAAIAYDIKALELFGATAKLNFPDQIGKLISPKRTSDLKSKTSKHKGINFQNNRWVATIFVDGKKKYLGSFMTEDEACQKRNQFVTWGDVPQSCASNRSKSYWLRPA